MSDEMLKRTLTAITLCSTVLATAAFAHDDDGKIRDRQKPYRGPGFRADDPKADGSVAGTFTSSGINLRS